MRYTLDVKLVRKAIDALTGVKSHEQFIMYLALLHLRKNQSKEITSGDLINLLKQWLDVPGNASYPYYRPFASRGHAYWMNSNLAGSFAYSSLRGASKDVFYSSDLPGNPVRVPLADEVRETLKIKTPVPFWGIACFILRNASFIGHEGGGGLASISNILVDYLGINEQAPFQELFNFDLPQDLDDDSCLVPEKGDGEAENTAELTLEREDYRVLDAEELGIEFDSRSKGGSARPNDESRGFLSGSVEIDSDERPVIEIIEALEDYSGVILSGAPGTSKSYYARRAANLITKHDDRRVAFVQFHPSYQFEDFVQGYRPNPEGGGFVLRDGIFLDMCEKAGADQEKLPYVLVIDELSRGDSQRIFGEALTYIEKSKRGLSFTLPSGKTTEVPENLYLIATMNPVDRGADDVDLAFGRRFGTIVMDPSPETLRARFNELGTPERVSGKIVDWFIKTNAKCAELELPGLGHAFFWDAGDLKTIERRWRLQIKPHINKLMRFEKEDRERTIAQFENLLSELKNELD